MSCSAAADSPSENSAVAVTTSAGSFFSVATCAAASAAARRLSGHAVKALEHAPAPRQRRIDVHGAQKGLDRGRCLPQGDVAIAALLVQAAEARMQSLECGERGKGRGSFAELPLRDRAQIQHVAILGHGEQQRLGRLQSVRETPLLQRARVCAEPRVPPSRAWPHDARRPRSLAMLCARLETVANRGAQDPRPQRCLRDDELIGADEHTVVRIAQVLAVHVDPPGILRDAE